MVNDDLDKSQQDYSEGVRNRKVFTSGHLIMGLPANVAIGGAALSLVVFILSTWWAALIMACIYFPPMISIHKEDSRAFQVWQSTLTARTVGWQAGHIAPRIFVVLSDRSSSKRG
jgi:hypothetical protein